MIKFVAACLIAAAALQHGRAFRSRPNSTLGHPPRVV
jgi:hypothetical protein